MIMRLDMIGWIALGFVIVGALNWGIVGVFSFDLIGVIFGKMSFLSRILYILIGLSGGWLIYAASIEVKGKK